MRKTGWVRSATVTCLALLIGGFPASAKEQDASTPPRTSGPLVGGSDFPCEEHGPVGSNESNAQSCYWDYALVPAESDVDEDFSALWAQLEIDPGRGSCAREISIEISAPSDGRITSASPAKSSRVKRKAPGLTKLVVEGDGSAPLPGEIEQDIIKAPGRTRVSVSPDEYRFSWKGSSRRKVMVAVGIEMAHTNVPPELISFQAISEGFTIGPCR